MGLYPQSWAYGLVQRVHVLSQTALETSFTTDPTKAPVYQFCINHIIILIAPTAVSVVCVVSIERQNPNPTHGPLLRRFGIPNSIRLPITAHYSFTKTSPRWRIASFPGLHPSFGRLQYEKCEGSLGMRLG